MNGSFPIPRISDVREFSMQLIKYSEFPEYLSALQEDRLASPAT